MTSHMRVAAREQKKTLRCITMHNFILVRSIVTIYWLTRAQRRVSFPPAF